ncbi:MAG: hypothetical protein KDC18_19795 [Alphaproteobacteria bacterium]|nr:hypothetical protein [Alphaproteobacteria bacterium]MCB9929614.1 hypothetical protein [Alphaproteobacteria bacterium]
MARDPKPQPNPAAADKAERLAQQLRANLRRRKAQASARRSPATDASAAPAMPAADEGKTKP